MLYFLVIVEVTHDIYTPGFRSNLILMSKLSIKGVKANFKGNKAFIKM